MKQIIQCLSVEHKSRQTHTHLGRINIRLRTCDKYYSIRTKWTNIAFCCRQFRRNENEVSLHANRCKCLWVNCFASGSHCPHMLVSMFACPGRNYFGELMIWCTLTCSACVEDVSYVFCRCSLCNISIV